MQYNQLIVGVNDLATTHPELAAQVHPDSHIKPDQVMAGSTASLLFQCKNGHTWESMTKNRALKDHGCPYCAGFRAWPGETDLATTHPDIAELIDPDSPIKANEISHGSGKKPLWRCPKGHTYRRAPRSVITSDGACPVCHEINQAHGSALKEDRIRARKATKAASRPMSHK